MWIFSKPEVENASSERMYFSLGAHPAFRMPLNPELKMKDYNLHIDTAAPYPLERHWINEAGLQNGTTTIVLNNANESIALCPCLFLRDALIFKDMEAAIITISAATHPQRLVFEYSGFPYLGIWSKPGATFVCIEPWSGITDHQDITGELVDKEGIIALKKNEKWAANWKVLIG